MIDKLKKRTLKLILILLILTLSGCSNSQTQSETTATPLQIAASIAISQTEMPPLSALTFDDAYLPTYLSIYQVDKALLTDAVICYAGGSEASEIAVLELNNEADAETVKSALLAYQNSRIDAFRGYVPDQEALAQNGFVITNGRYVALIIAADSGAAQSAFMDTFTSDWTAPDAESIFTMSESASNDTASETAVQETATQEAAADSNETIQNQNATQNTVTEETIESSASDSTETLAAQDEETISQEPTQSASETSMTTETAATSTTTTENPSENTSDDAALLAEDTYDKAAILEVWNGGDPNTLSTKNRAIYDAATAVIDQVITDDMSDYEKELAIHNQILSFCTYDTEANSNAPDASPDPDNDNPYGPLVKGVGICWGYTYTFELFMDMLDITCISVGGSSRDLPHAWNMVQLDGNWYCVDVTWNDSNANKLRYFNVTSDFMRATNHQWDATNVPEAVTQ